MAALKAQGRFGNQATMVQCLECIVRDRHSLWEPGGGAPNPKETSNLRLKVGAGISRCRREDWHSRQGALPVYRQEKPPWYRLGSQNIEPGLCWWAVVVGKRG